MHPFSKAQRFALQISLILLLFLTITACSANFTTQQKILLAPHNRLPAEVQEAPISVQKAYQFAVANPDILKAVPCYCGCGAAGHTSNYDCYVKGIDASGDPLYDRHALGCSICVDITQDVMRMMSEGKSLSEIRQAIDRTYSQYGPSNLPIAP